MDGDDGTQTARPVVAEHHLLVVVGLDAVKDEHLASAFDTSVTTSSMVGAGCVL
jgi:hypothetical protein